MLKNCALFVDVVLHIMRLFLLRRSLVTTRAMSSSAWAAVCQMTVTSDVKANLEQATGLVETAANKGAAMVFLPEKTPEKTLSRPTIFPSPFKEKLSLTLKTWR